MLIYFSSVVLEHKMILWLPKCCGAVLITRRYVMNDIRHPKAAD
jgi:hypothetical protein